MVMLDHTILRVSNIAASIRFYRDVLGFEYIGRAGPFEMIRINTELTLDLMEVSPKDPMHFAFSFDRATFDALHARLLQYGIAFGSDVFERDGRIAQNSFGAKGNAQAFYFYDPDRHNLEARLYTQ
ncbi:MAG: hypothetical protein JWM78_1524 [Verrucomicrobiaceae bacterium]|nr:hypothetical protein [Verrucomicrobiaceae bacterium]